MSCEQLLLNARRVWTEFETTISELAELQAKVVSDTAKLQEDRARMEQDREQLRNDRIQFEAEKEAMTKLGTDSNDLISLSFRGEKTVTMKRSTLCQVEGSMMAAMFSGRYDDKLDFDKDGNVFLSYPPQVMLPVVDWLTAQLDLAPGASLRDVDIPSEYRDILEGALKFFGLEEVVYPTTMFGGIRTNLNISDLQGWEVAFCEPYSHRTSFEDFQLPGVAGGSAVLVGARKAGADTLLLAAMGRLDVITAKKPRNSTKLHNGVYWYCSDNWSIGFAPDATVNMDSGDIHDMASPCRMSWLLTGRGGRRAGSHNDLYESLQFEKVIMRPHRSLMMNE